MPGRKTVRRLPLTASQQLARWRRTRQLVWLVLLLLGASVLPGLMGRPDDWAAFDRRRLHVVRVVSGDCFLIQSAAGDNQVKVHLVGVAAPQGSEHWASQSRKALAERVEGKDVLLRLENTQTRTADGMLLAYVRLNDLEDVNLELIRDGQAYSDPRITYSTRNQFEQAEADARKKSRGLWRGLTDEQMPVWRQRWLEGQREIKRRKATTQSAGFDRQIQPALSRN